MKDRRGGRSWEEMTPEEKDEIVAVWMGYEKNPEGVRGMGWKTPDRKFIGLGSLPRFTTDINAAWMVMKKLHPQYRVALIGYLDGTWRCEIRGSGTEFITAADASTSEEAICLAALRAGGITL